MQLVNCPALTVTLPFGSAAGPLQLWPKSPDDEASAAVKEGRQAREPSVAKAGGWRFDSKTQCAQGLGSSLLGLALMLILTVAQPQARAGDQVEAWGAGTTVASPPDQNNYGQSIIPTNLTNAVFVAGGWRHSLSVNADGTVQGWGDDSFGQQDFAPDTNGYVAVAAGQLHSVALDGNGMVATAGDDLYGQADAPAGLSNVVAVASGFYHSLALEAGGTVTAWGAGLTNDPSDLVDYGQSIVPTNLFNVVAIAGGGWHSLALLSDGTVRGWGRDDFGQAAIPPGLSNVVALAAGAAYSLVLKADGTLVAWGDNTYGQTVTPAGLSNVIAIAAGGWHGLALENDGTVAAWGAGLGTNANVDCGQSTVPAGLSNVAQIAAGAVNSLVLETRSPPPQKIILVNPVISARQVTFFVPVRNGRVYRLEYKNSLTNSDWTALPLVAGRNGTVPLTDPAPPSSQRFYRVAQW